MGVILTIKKVFAALFLATLPVGIGRKEIEEIQVQQEIEFYLYSHRIIVFTLYIGGFTSYTRILTCSTMMYFVFTSYTSAKTYYFFIFCVPQI